MTPYYDDGTCVIYHGDCREIACWRAAHVLITDPPYGLETDAGSYGRHGATIANDRDTRTRDAMLTQWAEPGLNGGPWRYNHELIFVAGDGWVRVGASSFSMNERYCEIAAKRLSQEVLDFDYGTKEIPA